KEQAAYKDLPVISKVTPQDVLANYLQIKKDIQATLQLEMERMMDTPELESLIIKKEQLL
ncbi:MAG: mobilization protein, partial [Bacteroidota bacterium]|nr:mobilization protein [Bacteroidota bacterium]